MTTAAVLPEIRKPVMSPPVPPPSVPTELAIKTLEPKGHVGFSSLPDQLVQKTVQHGFTFNLICVGETGIGKSTLTESLFNMKFDFKPCSYELKSVELKSHVFDVEEGKVKLKLTVIETAGFGDQLDKENSLKALDVAALKDLSKRVNIIPIIAKADTISKDELHRFKAKILSELKANSKAKAKGIEFYKFPEDDETMREVNAQLNKCVPFAVVGSVDFVKVNNKMVRARQYPWGMVEVENEEHCDFVKLREALLRLNVEDLRERTHRILYETYRRQRLHEMGLKDGDLGPCLRQIFELTASVWLKGDIWTKISNILESLSIRIFLVERCLEVFVDELMRTFQRRAEHLANVRSKEEALKAHFVQRVKKKEHDLNARERELNSREIEEKRKFDEELAVLKSEQVRLAAEIGEFDAAKQKFLKDQRKLKH